jgi:hypothetical protein
MKCGKRGKVTYLKSRLAGVLVVLALADSLGVRGGIVHLGSGLTLGVGGLTTFVGGGHCCGGELCVWDEGCGFLQENGLLVFV